MRWSNVYVSLISKSQNIFIPLIRGQTQDVFNGINSAEYTEEPAFGDVPI